MNTRSSSYTGRAPRDLNGAIFNELTLLEEVDPDKSKSGKTITKCLFRCSCGVEKVIRYTSVKSGSTKSCGHLARDQAAARMKAYATTHGKSKTPIYKVWQSMIRRCHDINNKSYGRYGAIGITVCERWRDSFESFLSDMGERPDGLTLDRIDSSLGYSPENCRWATYTEQARNTRRNRLHTIDGVTRCMAEWCEILDVRWSAAKKRLALGRDPFVSLRNRKRLK